ncbi:MAG TPA: hypothetical protein PLU35_10395 [Phycisphaerales bacterium]|nr:hypothetical protein [Phycisphaerales bacterium]
MPAATIIRRAYAKLNLALAVGPPEGAGSARPGWHRIASWSCAVGLADEVRVRRLPEGAASTWSFACAPDAPRRIAFDWPVTTDLTFRAHGLLEREARRSLPAAISVTKRIPPGGGLGGDRATLRRRCSRWMNSSGWASGRTGSARSRRGSGATWRSSSTGRTRRGPRS